MLLTSQPWVYFWQRLTGVAAVTHVGQTTGPSGIIWMTTANSCMVKWASRGGRDTSPDQKRQMPFTSSRPVRVGGGQLTACCDRQEVCGPHISSRSSVTHEHSYATSFFLFLEDVPRPSWAQRIRSGHTLMSTHTEVIQARSCQDDKGHWKWAGEGAAADMFIQEDWLIYTHRRFKEHSCPQLCVCVCVCGECWKTTLETSFPWLFLAIWRVRSHIKSSI